MRAAQRIRADVSGRMYWTLERLESRHFYGSVCVEASVSRVLCLGVCEVCVSKCSRRGVVYRSVRDEVLISKRWNVVAFEFRGV
jgi:hypothetical protein